MQIGKNVWEFQSITIVHPATTKMMTIGKKKHGKSFTKYLCLICIYLYKDNTLIIFIYICFRRSDKRLFSLDVDAILPIIFYGSQYYVYLQNFKFPHRLTELLLLCRIIGIIYIFKKFNFNV